MLLTLTFTIPRARVKNNFFLPFRSPLSPVCVCVNFLFSSLRIQPCLTDGAGVPGVSCRVAESQAAAAAAALICISVFAPESAAFGSA